MEVRPSCTASGDTERCSLKTRAMPPPILPSDLGVDTILYPVGGTSFTVSSFGSCLSQVSVIAQISTSLSSIYSWNCRILFGMDLAFTCAKCRLLDLGKGVHLMGIKLLWFGSVGWNFLLVVVFEIMLCIMLKRFLPPLEHIYGVYLGCFLIPREIIHDLVN